MCYLAAHEAHVDRPRPCKPHTHTLKQVVRINRASLSFCRMLIKPHAVHRLWFSCNVFRPLFLGDCVSWIQSGADGPGLPFWRNRETISNSRLPFHSSYSYQLLRRESDCLTAIIGCECCLKSICLQQVEWNHQTLFFFCFLMRNWIERKGFT